MVPTGIILNIYQTLTIWPNSPQTTNLQDKCSYDDYLRSKETGIETGSLPELMKSYVAAGFRLLGDTWFQVQPPHSVRLGLPLSGGSWTQCDSCETADSPTGSDGSEHKSVREEDSACQEVAR